MDAVIFNGPFKIDVEKRPKPTLLEPTDAIVKVTVAGVCGSELHMYRGHQKTATGHIMGHEFVGYVEEIGLSVTNYKIGQKVVCTFSPVCLSCFFCKNGYTNRCPVGTAPFGTQGLAGGQADYVRVPYADGTLQPAPETVPEDLLIMMSDIFPTGYYGAMRAIEYFAPTSSSSGELNGDSGTHAALSLKMQTLDKAIFVCLGCGPVGLCAILTARSKGVRTIYVVDSVDDRLEQAAKLGGIPLKLGRDDIPAIIKEATGGRGADAVIEVVGNTTAMRSAFDLLRPAGVLSSLGFHQGDLPFTALDCYQKNLNINLGRAPVRTVYDEALEVVVANKDKLSGMITHRLPLSQAAHGYDIFEKQQARKVILIPGQ
ncbi:chaperonin 10-like protein [Exophiala viscosa]|uniref:Chaperonin 10-like protein n=1 Tax=Exophiala viscosa TaxID=2486360 RepID=A0AAN6DQS3_9EURO|nr:chaperonin 10-like protein [Exophiala viscosa]